MPKNEEKNNSKETYTPDEKSAAQTKPPNAISMEDLARFVSSFRSDEPNDSGKLDELRDKINCDLTQLSAISVAFPECSDVMLSLINQRMPRLILRPESRKMKSHVISMSILLFADTP